MENDFDDLLFTGADSTGAAATLATRPQESAGAGASTLPDDDEAHAASSAALGQIPEKFQRTIATVVSPEIDFEATRARLDQDATHHFGLAGLGQAVGDQYISPERRAAIDRAADDYGVDREHAQRFTDQMAGARAMQDVQDALTNRPVHPERAQALQEIGLLQQTPEADGNSRWRVTNDALPLLAPTLQQAAQVRPDVLAVPLVAGPSGETLDNLVQAGKQRLVGDRGAAPAPTESAGDARPGRNESSPPGADLDSAAVGTSAAPTIPSPAAAPSARTVEPSEPFQDPQDGRWKRLKVDPATQEVITEDLQAPGHHDIDPDTGEESVQTRHGRQVIGLDPAFVERQRQQQALAQSRAAMAPFAPADPAYRVNPDGTVSFDPQRLLKGLQAAQEAGAIAPEEARRLAPLAAQAEQAARDQAKLLANDSVASKLRALGYGAGKGAIFLAGATPGAEAGAGLGAFGGPADPVTIPLVGAIGGAITGGVATWGADKIFRQLGAYNDTIKSFTDAADYHPGYDAAGNLVAIMAGSPGSIANLARTGAAMKAVGAAPGAIVKAIGARVAGSAGVNVAIDTAIKEGAHALGLQPEGQTLGGALEAAAIGAFLSGRGMKIGGYTPKEIGAAVAKARAGQALTAEEAKINAAFVGAMKGRVPEGMPANSPGQASILGSNAGGSQNGAGGAGPMSRPASDTASRLPRPFGAAPAGGVSNSLGSSASGGSPGAGGSARAGESGGGGGSRGGPSGPRPPGDGGGGEGTGNNDGPGDPQGPRYGVKQGIPVPRVNVASQFTRRPTSGGIRYVFGDTETHGLSAKIDKDGILGFNIKANQEKPESGIDMFASLMQRLKADGYTVRGIRGSWFPNSGSKNHAEYASNVKAGMEAKNAAFQTWTGDLARRYGFTKVRVSKPMNPGESAFPIFTRE